MLHQNLTYMFPSNKVKIEQGSMVGVLHTFVQVQIIGEITLARSIVLFEIWSTSLSRFSCMQGPWLQAGAIFFCCCQWDQPACYHQCVCHFADSACSRMKWTRSRSTLKKKQQGDPLSIHDFSFMQACDWTQSVFFLCYWGTTYKHPCFSSTPDLVFFFSDEDRSIYDDVSHVFPDKWEPDVLNPPLECLCQLHFSTQTDGQSCMFEWYEVYIWYGKNNSSNAHSYVRFQKKWALKPNHRLLNPTSTLQAIQASTLWAMTLPGRNRAMADFWNSLEL